MASRILLLPLACAAVVSGFAPAARPAVPAGATVLRASRGSSGGVMYAKFAAPEETADGKPSFVGTEMRGAAMALHTKDQSREGQQAAQKPVSAWEPQQKDYLQFLVDSREVYSRFEQIVSAQEALAPFRSSGLERTSALDDDIAWFASELSLPAPPVGPMGKAYAAKLEALASEGNFEALVCHFYNFYFAHTAGGRMIGKMMSDKLLGGKKLQFYTWSAGNVDKDLIPALRSQIDGMAETWSREQKDACLAVTGESFKFGGSLLSYLKEPVLSNV